MKTVTGRVISAEPISLFMAAKLISGFASSDNGASQAVSAYLRRTSTAFNELKNIHREVKSKETKQRSDSRRERNPNSEFDEGKKTPFRKNETVSEKEAIYGREHEEIKEEKKEKKSKEVDVIDEKVNEKLEEEQEERKGKKKKKKKKKKKRKIDEEIGSEERKSKKKKKSKEIDG